MRLAARDSRADFDTILKSLSIPPTASTEPVLILCAGLPGTGKSTLAGRIAAETDAVVLESDALRSLLFDTPGHSPDENAHLFRAIHKATRTLLERGATVIVDATSLLERDRRPLYAIADGTNARLIILLLDAPRRVVEERLGDRTDSSQANMSVYNRMEDTLQAPSRQYRRVDTSDAAATDAALRWVVEACRPGTAAVTGGRV